MRALLVLGLFVKHFDFEKSGLSLQLISSDNQKDQIDNIFKLFIQYYSYDDLHIKQHVIQGIFYLYSRQPKLLLDKGSAAILEEIFRNDAPPLLSITGLNSVREFLESEEDRDKFLQNK